MDCSPVRRFDSPVDRRRRQSHFCCHLPLLASFARFVVARLIARSARDGSECARWRSTRRHRERDWHRATRRPRPRAHAGAGSRMTAAAPGRAADRDARRTQRSFAPARIPHPAPVRVHAAPALARAARDRPNPNPSVRPEAVSETASDRVLAGIRKEASPVRFRQIPMSLDTIRRIDRPAKHDFAKSGGDPVSPELELIDSAVGEQHHATPGIVGRSGHRDSKALRGRRQVSARSSGVRNGKVCADLLPANSSKLSVRTQVPTGKSFPLTRPHDKPFPNRAGRPANRRAGRSDPLRRQHRCPDRRRNQHRVGHSRLPWSERRLVDWQTAHDRRLHGKRGKPPRATGNDGWSPIPICSPRSRIRRIALSSIWNGAAS